MGEFGHKEGQMEVLQWQKARRFYKKHPEAESPLKKWKQVVLAQGDEWTNFTDIKASFGAADWVEGKVVFDIKGNDFRLIAVVYFQDNKLWIRDIITHAEYDKGNWKKRK
jgi:mRNA interferase HigB